MWIFLNEKEERKMASFQWLMEISFEEITNFTKFLENEKIVKFLEADSCHRYSDKYLLGKFRNVSKNFQNISVYRKVFSNFSKKLIK